MPRWLRLLSKAILTGSVVAAIVVAVDPSALMDSLRKAQWAWVFVAVLLLPVNVLLDGLVWKSLLESILDRVDSRAVGRAVLSGLALGFWTPARVGEYAGRALSLPRGDRWSISLTVFAQRMVDMAVGVAVGLLVLVAALYRGVIPSTFPWLATLAVGLGTTAVLATFVVAPSLVHRLTQWLLPTRTAITGRTALFRRLSKRKRVVVVGGTFGRYLVFTGQFALLGAAFAQSAPWSLLVAAAALTFYVKYLIPSLTLLDLGIRESGAAFFFLHLGLGAAAGVNAALVLFSINVLTPAVLGLPFVSDLHLPAPEEASTASPHASVPGS